MYRAYKAGDSISPPSAGTMSDEAKKVLFGQTAATIQQAATKQNVS